MIKIPHNVGNAIEKIENDFGKGRLYKIEWILSHYKESSIIEPATQEAVDTIVRFIKHSEKNREDYFKALVEGYEKECPKSYAEYSYKEKQELFDKYIELIKPFFFAKSTFNLEIESRKNTDCMHIEACGVTLNYPYHDTGNRTFMLHVNGGVKD